MTAKSSIIDQNDIPRRRMHKHRLTLLAATFAIAIVACNGCLGPRIQKPQSDVPVISNIGWWPYQNYLYVDDLTVTVVDAPLNLFNNKALVRFQVRGRLTGQGVRRPYIKEVQLSQRLSGASGDLVLVPVVDVREDSSYAGDDVTFDVKVEQLVESLDWGSNRYVVVAGDKRAEFTLEQRK